MPRYYFRVIDPMIGLPDEIDQDCQNIVDAAGVAERIARDLATDDGTYSGFAIVAIDEQGKEIARVPVR